MTNSTEMRAGTSGEVPAPGNDIARQAYENSNTPEVYRAICKVAKAISHEGIAKGRRNEQQGYGFRGIDDVMNGLSALLAGAELVVLPRMTRRKQQDRQSKTGGLLLYVTVQADFVLVSARDGSQHTVTMYGEAMDSADKATNKAMSAAYKYAMLQTFCIPTEAMPDADSQTPEPLPEQPERKPAAKAAGATKPAATAATAATADPPAPFANYRDARSAASAAIAEKKIASGEPLKSDFPWPTVRHYMHHLNAACSTIPVEEVNAELRRYGFHDFYSLQVALRNNKPLAREKAYEIYTHFCSMSERMGVAS